MTTHRLSTQQLIPAPIDRVFDFFSRPENLGRITPADLDFQLLTSDVVMRDGVEIEYRIRPLLGVPVTWRTRIDEFLPPHRFVDSQLRGPYRRWVHTHTFEETAHGTLVRDQLVYELPYGWLGDLGHRMLVRPQIEVIFRHRARILDSVFAPAGTLTQPLTVGVAGGTGFVGGGIAAELHARGHRVVVLSHRGEPARLGLPDTVEMRSADVTSERGLTTAMDGLDALVIALAFPNSPIEAPRRGRTFQAVDAEGTQRLVAAGQAANVGRIVYLSGAGAAPDASRHWFRAKWQAEEAIRSSGRSWTIIRPTWIYGPRDVSLNRFIGLARRLPFVPLTNRGRQLLAPVFVDDVAHLVADSLVDEAAVDQVFELGGPEVLPMRDIIRTALRVARVKRPILPGPTLLLKLGVLPLTLLPAPPMTPDAIDFINQPATVDTSPLLARMPRRLTPLEEGLATYLSPGSGPGRIVFDDLGGRGKRTEAIRPAL
jgi:uncharacterized protein YbjT (DUF2867 family)/ligand-binding SRPBCC domain-containing protein